MKYCVWLTEAILQAPGAGVPAPDPDQRVGVPAAARQPQPLHTACRRRTSLVHLLITLPGLRSMDSSTNF